MTASIADDNWIEAAVSRYHRPLLAYAWRLVGNLEQARDIVQDTFTRLCAQPRTEVEGHLAPWLYTVCRNRAIDLARKEKRMTSIQTDHLSEMPADHDQAPPAAAEHAESHARVLTALTDLPENQQEVIRLKFQQSLSYKDIAAVTGLAPSYVGYLLHVGLKTLRERLATQA